ncbi:MAG: hypothetical protein K0R51_3460 [Cytophagaceae bacterium]|jgi:hypothetical protein|nr:hypothetical protein [Cytophagaceae bacterium]
MAIGLENFPNITPPDSDFPSGRIKDDTGINDGTPVDLFTNGDVQETFAKLLRMSSITPNGLPDSEYSGHQYIEALINLMNTTVGSNLVKAIIGTYTPNDVIILWGVNITPPPVGSSVITDGAIFYNDKIYRVQGGTVVTASDQTLVYKISTSGNPNFAYLAAGPSNSGISNWDQAKHIDQYIPKTDGLVKIRTKVVPIGNWNMNSTDNVSINHGVSDFTKILSCAVTIINDAGTLLYTPYDAAFGVGGNLGISNINPTDVTIYRIDGSSGGIFDNSNFQNTGISRGNILIQYMV